MSTRIDAISWGSRGLSDRSRGVLTISSATSIPSSTLPKAAYCPSRCGLSLGRDGRYYFVFTLPEQLVDELPKELVRQASAIAQKVMKNLIIEN